MIRHITLRRRRCDAADQARRQERGRRRADPVLRQKIAEHLHRRAGAAAQRLPQPHQDPAGAAAGAGGLDVEALLEPGRPGAGRRSPPRSSAPTRRSRRAVAVGARRGPVGSSTSCSPAAAASAPAPPRSCATSWASACSACRRTDESQRTTMADHALRGEGQGRDDHAQPPRQAQRVHRGHDRARGRARSARPSATTT